MASNEWQLSRAKLQSSLEASGPCACGRSTCARKTNDATLLQARQQMNRCQHLRRAKLQSARPIASSTPVSWTEWTCSASQVSSQSSADCEATSSSSSPVYIQTAPSSPTPVVAKTLAHSDDGLSAEEYLYDNETDDSDQLNPTISGQRLGRETRLNRFCRT